MKQRKVPERKCLVTGEMKPKNDLIRIVRNKEGDIFVDPTGKKNGRGAYVSKNIDAINKAEKTGVLNKQFQTEIESSIYEELRGLVDHHDEK